jgi:hypothetical protein
MAGRVYLPRHLLTALLWGEGLAVVLDELEGGFGDFKLVGGVEVVQGLENLCSSHDVCASIVGLYPL